METSENIFKQFNLLIVFIKKIFWTFNRDVPEIDENQENENIKVETSRGDIFENLQVFGQNVIQSFRCLTQTKRDVTK